MTWPTLTCDGKRFAGSCEACQLRARVTCFGRVPISAVPRDAEISRHWFMDCAGRLLPGESVHFNYALILVDSAIRCLVAYALRSLSAKHACEALLISFMMNGIASGLTVSSDNGSHLCSKLTREFMSRLNISPVFSKPGHPPGCALVERAIGTLKYLVSKLS